MASLYYINILFYILFLFNVFVIITSTEFPKDEELYPILTINQGQVQGLRRSLPSGQIFYSFKGIPYAKPPVGPLRFRDPLPYGNWSGVRNAFEDGPVCIQVGMESQPTVGEEDCLYINVYTPSLQNNGTKKYPVMLFIHGGGWIIGSGFEVQNPPKTFMEQDVIMVTFNYRLGIFGFLSLDTPEVPGNAALKDQHLAIKWVKENIAHFNGDENNIVLSGVSAGSASVEYQILHKKSKGLFHKTRMQSGSAVGSWSLARNNHKSLEKLAHVLGVNNDPQEMLNALSQLSADEVSFVEQMCKDEEFIRQGFLFSPFIPVIEKEFPNVEPFITEDPLELYKNGEYLNVPSLVTFCREEGSLFTEMYGGQHVSDMRNRNYTKFLDFINIRDTRDIDKDLTKFYQSMGVDEMKQVIEFTSDIMFFIGAHHGLKYYVRENMNHYYAYSFSFVGNITNPEPFPPGAPHVIDSFYEIFFDDNDLNEEEKEIRKVLRSIHGNFIKTGNPNGLSTIQFDPITADAFNVLHIGNDGVFMAPFPYGDRMDYWNNLL